MEQQEHIDSELLPAINDDLINLKTINNKHFTRREIDIIACIIGGRSSKRISSFLSISTNTVESHVRNIMLKLGCNSRENIIDFLEKSDKFAILKKHYSNLLIQASFELELKKILKLTKDNNISCLVFYYKKQTEKNLFISELEKNLNIAGINTISKIWERGKTENFLFDRLELHPIDYIVYVVTDNFLDQLEKDGNKIIEEAVNLITIFKQKANNIIFIMLNNEKSLEGNEKFANFTCIDFKEHKNYYLLVFEIIKKLLLTNNIDKNINNFKKNYAVFLEHSHAKIWLKREDGISIKSFIDYFRRFKELGMAVITIFLLTISIVFMTFMPDKHGQITNQDNTSANEVIINARHTRDNNIIQQSEDVPKRKSTKTKYNSHINKDTDSVGYASIRQEAMLLNLPSRNFNFTGRKEALQQIERQLNKHTFGIITQAISGLGGIGKTQLATEFVYQSVKKNAYDIVFWVIAEDTASIANSYREFANQLHIDIRGLRLNEIQTLVHNKVIKGYNTNKVLFVLDNVPTYEKIQSHLENLRKQWPTNYALQVLITTRSQYWHVPPLILNIFTPNEASNYVKRHVPNERDDIIKQLTKELHYFPLALSQAVAYVKEYTNIEDYLKLYRENKPTYLNKFSDDKNQKTLWNTLSIILSKLSNNAKEVLYASAYINPDDIPIEFFNNLSVEDRVNAISELRKHSLVTLTNLNRSFFIHRMLQDIIKLNIQLGAKGNETIWVNRAMDLLADKFDFNYTTPNKWHLWQQYLSHSYSVAKHAVKMQGKTFERGIKLYFKTAMMVTFVQREMKIATKIWDTIKQIVAERYTGATANLIIADIDVSCSLIWRILGEYDISKACIENAIATYQHLDANGIPKVQELTSALKLIPFNTMTLSDSINYDLSYALMRLGNIYRELGKYDKALINYNKSLSIIEKYKNISVAQYYYADILWNIGDMHTYAGNLIEAEKVLTTTKKIVDKKYINHPSRAYLYNYIAMFMYNIGKFQEAKELAETAISIRTIKFADNHHMLAFVKFLIGIVNFSCGDIKQAKINLTQAEEIYNMSFKKQHVRYVMFYLNLHRVYEYTKEYDKSLNHLDKALVIAKENYGEKIHDAVSYKVTRAEFWPKLVQTVPIFYWQKALNKTILLFGENHYQTARYHYLLGQALQKHGGNAKAKINYEKALTIMQKGRIPHPNLAKYYQKNIAAIQTKLDELPGVK